VQQHPAQPSAHTHTLTLTLGDRRREWAGRSTLVHRDRCEALA
jgi:hypothetical protein